MSSLFGIEAPRAVLFVVAFAIILALVVLFGVVLRKLTGARLMMPGNDRARSRQPRLGIVDVYDLDRQRQLLLLRRDNVEHLLLIGGPNDVVIETNIVRVAGARIPPAANEAGAERYDPSLEQAPRAPQMEASGRPSIESQLAAQLGTFVRRPSEESDADQELSAIASVSAPVPAHPEPVLKPDAVTVSATPALRAEARIATFPDAPAAPSSIAERPDPRPVFTPPTFQSRPTPTAPVAPPAPPRPEPARPPQAAPIEREAPVERNAPEAVVLSDMAKQLEEALRRPASPVAAPPVAPIPVAPAPVAPRMVHDEAGDEDDFLEPTPMNDAPFADYEEREDEVPVTEQPPAPVPQQPRPAAVEPVRPAPSPLPPQSPGTPAGSPKAADPFSVEDIEAEFARLLGRPLDQGKKE